MEFEQFFNVLMFLFTTVFVNVHADFAAKRASHMVNCTHKTSKNLEEKAEGNNHSSAEE